MPCHEGRNHVSLAVRLGGRAPAPIVPVPDQETRPRRKIGNLGLLALILLPITLYGNHVFLTAESGTDAFPRYAESDSVAPADRASRLQTHVARGVLTSENLEMF